MIGRVFREQVNLTQTIRPASRTFRLPGVSAAPQQRQFSPLLSSKCTRNRIRSGVSTLSDVWIGSYKNPIKAKGPNFAGHYFVIRWGCGSQCVMMTTVDAETGKVYDPLLADKGSLWVPLDNLSDMETDLRPDSSLLVLRNACRDFKDRKTCGTDYCNWKDNHFDLVRFIYVNPLQEQ